MFAIQPELILPILGKFDPNTENGCIATTLFPNKILDIYFFGYCKWERKPFFFLPIFGINNGKEKRVPHIWDWERNCKTVFPTQVGRKFTKKVLGESWEQEFLLMSVFLYLYKTKWIVYIIIHWVSVRAWTRCFTGWVNSSKRPLIEVLVAE